MARGRTLIALALAAAAPAAAHAAGRVVDPGRIDPPYGPSRPVGTPVRALVAAWGPGEIPLPGDPPIASWPAGVEVTLGPAPARRAEKFTVTRPGWRTRAGVRIGSPEAAVVARYGRGRLVRVADRRGILGSDHHLMLPAGRMAIGFVLRRGRVFWMTTGPLPVVRADLAVAGPL